MDLLAEGYKIQGPIAKNGFLGPKKYSLLDSNHDVATTRQRKVHSFQINISFLLVFFWKKWILGSLSAFWQNVKTAVSL